VHNTVAQLNDSANYKHHQLSNVVIEPTSILVETSTSVADFGERRSRTENSASGKENGASGKKIAVINVSTYFQLEISDKK